jgi:glycosyltransferase involved in cell wall biosynthesis
MTKRICLVTTGQPSTNPRLVKEADALSAAGFEVHVVGAHWAEWADRTDLDLVRQRRWSHRIIDWRRETAWWMFWKSRVRHHAALSAFRAPLVGRAFATRAASRVAPELVVAADAWPADLYIAHNLGALPAAALAARRYDAKLGFDAEDFHRGELHADQRAALALVRHLEERYLAECAYVTAASPGIAAAYAPLCRRPPTVVLNVFPLSQRPAAQPARRPGPLRVYWFSQTIGRARGLEDVVAAMGLLPDVPVELHLRGVWQPGFAADLQVIARSAQVAWDRIVSHDPAPPEEMVRLAAEYDAGLALEVGHTANADILLSNKIFTYLLAGIPVLASATTAQAALVRELGAAAAMAPVGDAPALAAALRRWAGDPDALAAGREAAWRLGATRFNWDIEQATFLAVVREVLGGDASGQLSVRGWAS